MNIFARYTLRSLGRSPMRTAVTAVGIVLSVALLTAVMEGAYSGLQYLMGVERETTGPYHGYFRCLTADEAAQVKEDPALAAVTVWRDAGWALPEGENSYIFFADVDENFENLVSVQLTEGRMPENDREIAVPRSALLYDRTGPLHAGDKAVFTVGRRIGPQGEELGEETYFHPEERPETLAEAQERTYTVVGVYETLPYDVTQSMRTVFLTRGGGTGPCRVFFTLKEPARYREFADAPWAFASPAARIMPHSALLRYYGGMGGEAVFVLYGLAGVLSFMVAFGSVSLIYNAFSISLKERTAQFGVLRSVGATKKQLRSMVFYEAAFLSAVCIPVGLTVGCGGIGVTLWALRGMFDTLLTGGDMALKTQMRLAVSPAALAIAALTALAVVAVSAWIPARRAARRGPMEAVRQTADVRISPREARVSPWTAKLFGFEGLMAAKSVRRDRKNARATVFALFLSITLFISATTFCAYVNDTVEIMGWGESGADLVAAGRSRSDPQAEDPEQTLAELSQAPGVTAGTYYMRSGLAAWLNAAHETEEFREFQERIHAFTDGGDQGRIYMYSTVTFLEDGLFRELCRENGVDPAPYFDLDAPQALFYDRFGYVADSDHGRRWESYTILDPAAFPTEAWESAGESKCFRLGAAIQEQAFPFGGTDPWIFYPAAVTEAVLGPEAIEHAHYEYAFLSENVQGTYDWMAERLSELGFAGRGTLSVGNLHRTRLIARVVNVFAGGFLTLIALIALANVFNTVSTGVSLRRRDLAMLRSLGLSRRGLWRMLRWECAAYSLRAALWGLPAAGALSWLVYAITSRVLTVTFYIPWASILAGCAGTFCMMAAAMAAAVRGTLQKDLAEELRTETF